MQQQQQQSERLALITSLRQSCDSEEVSRLIAELGELRDVKEHAMGIGAFARARDAQSALGLLDEMQLRGIAPNVFAFNAALSACAKTGEWERALGLLDEMRANRVAPELLSFNAAISACARAGRWGKTLSLLSTMRKAGQPPDLISFNGALVAARAGGRADVALQLITQMRDREIAPDAGSYGAAVSACRRAGDGASAAALVESMVAEGLAPSESLLTDALGACAKSGAHAAAAGLWARLESMSGGAPLGAKAYAARVHERGTAGDWEGALALLDAMQHVGVAVDAACCNQAARACGLAGSAAAAEAALSLLRRSAKDYEVVATDRMWRSAIQACGAASQGADAVLELLDEAAAARASAVGVYGAAMHALAYGGGGSAEGRGEARTRCLALLARMDGEGVAPDVGVFNAALHACQRAADWQQVYDLLHRMRRDGLTSTATLGGFHVRLWKRAKLELGLCQARDPKSGRSKNRERGAQQKLVYSAKPKDKRKARKKGARATA